MTGWSLLVFPVVLAVAFGCGWRGGRRPWRGYFCLETGTWIGPWMPAECPIHGTEECVVRGRMVNARGSRW